MARPLVAAGCIFVVVLWVARDAGAQTASQDVTRAPAAAGATKSKWAGSFAEGSTYVGTSAFYASGYVNRYASLALYAKPTYDLGTKYALAVRARIYLEEELTTPDNPTGRRFYPYDPWVWLAADNLHTFERAKVRMGGLVRGVLPVSYESRYENLLFGLIGGVNFNRDFEFGQVNDEARKWTLRLTWASIGGKYFHSSEFRGNGPGDTTGCLAPPAGGAPGITDVGGPGVSAADRCGGPANTSFYFGNTVLATLSRGKWSGMASLYVVNSFKYSVGSDVLTPDAAVATGRSDTTWGILALGYQLQPHVSLSAGISSMQPALDSRYRYPRFPFFDFSGASANNFTQMFLSVSGSL